MPIDVEFEAATAKQWGFEIPKKSVVIQLKFDFWIT
jgi:hypothetical protein